jgi:hypothetical protein
MRLLRDEMLEAGREILRASYKKQTSDIPDDIMKTARELCQSEQFHLMAVFGKAILDEGTIEVVARALLAERERCAIVAENDDYFPSEGAAIARAIRNA